ncbi:MAG TPA: hypothetical protein VJY66_03560 [Acholeplasma sp.]|nr:hypothetical protein [Acholeplasma sp.]
MGKKNKITGLTKSFFSRLFGFEENIDITDDVIVLHRRNIVIKNIIFLSNIMYSVILFLIAFSTKEPSDWLFSALALPLTIFINNVIKRLIFGDRHDKTKQEVAMYVLSMYMFLSSVLIYARLYKNEPFETAAYILLYYAIVVVSLYQSKRLIMWVFQGMLASITIIHFVWTYSINTIYKGLSMQEFLIKFLPTKEAIDIFLRTAFFVIFMIVIYAIVSIGSYMQEQRKFELMKRREVQDDFTLIVSDLFNVVLSSKKNFLDKLHVDLVSIMSQKLSTYFGLSSQQIEYIETYSRIHMRYMEIEAMLADQLSEDETKFEILKEKTALGTQIAKRLQLAQKAEDIARAHVEGVATISFTQEMNEIQPQIESQIILLCDLYITMRSGKSYKRPYPNQTTVTLFEKTFLPYFDYFLIERFLKFKNEFEIIFNEY